MAALKTFVEDWNGHAFAHPLKFDELLLSITAFSSFLYKLKFQILYGDGEMLWLCSSSIKISILSKKWTLHLCAVNRRCVETACRLLIHMLISVH